MACQRVHLVLCEKHKMHSQHLVLTTLMQQHKKFYFCPSFLLIILHFLQKHSKVSPSAFDHYVCFKYTLSLKSAINSGHWLGFPSKVISSAGVRGWGGNYQDSNSWWSVFITVGFARLLMGSTTSSPSKSWSINSSIGFAKGLILSDDVWSFAFSEISWVSRR